MVPSGSARHGEFEAALKRHVLDPWFPRCLDNDHGGFLCDFDRMWRPCGTHDKLLEFQARQTLSAAEALRFYPNDQRFRLAVAHGVRCLREVMWDPDAGGWYHLTDRAGRPLEAQTKHTHGFAYAIQACAAAYAVTGDAESLALAKDGFAWMDHHARDHDHGGYFGFLSRDGVPIMQASQCPWPAERDTVNTEFGLKDLNVHSDLVETFVYLYRVWPDATVGARLDEILDIVTERMVVPSTGAMHFFVTPDWRPIPHLIRAGYQCHNAFRILMAVGMAGDPDHLRRTARKMVDHALRYLVDHHTGGFYYASPGAGPEILRGQDIRVKSKDWWVQMEALKVLRAISLLIPEEEEYTRAFVTQWQYVKNHLLDEEFGGVYSAGLDQDSRWRQQLGPAFALASTTRKGDRWKDASHDTRALLYCAETDRPASR